MKNFFTERLYFNISSKITLSGSLLSGPVCHFLYFILCKRMHNYILINLFFYFKQSRIFV